MNKLAEKIRKHLWLIILIAAVIVGGFGVYRGEAIEVFEKAKIVCLECIGIG